MDLYGFIGAAVLNDAYELVTPNQDIRYIIVFIMLYYWPER